LSCQERREFEASLRYFDVIGSGTPVRPSAHQAVDRIQSHNGIGQSRLLLRALYTANCRYDYPGRAPTSINQLLTLLRKRLAIPVLAAFGDAKAKKSTDVLSQRLLTPIAYKALRRGKQLDLLPAKLRVAARQRTHFRYSLYAATLAVTAALLASVFQFIVLGGLTQEEERLRSTLADIKNSIPYQEWRLKSVNRLSGRHNWHNCAGRHPNTRES